LKLLGAVIPAASLPGIAREDGREHPYDPAIHLFSKMLYAKVMGVVASAPNQIGRNPL
jgi:hypothetical protein